LREPRFALWVGAGVGVGVSRFRRGRLSEWLHAFVNADGGEWEGFAGPVTLSQFGSYRPWNGAYPCAGEGFCNIEIPVWISSQFGQVPSSDKFPAWISFR
jgi:hypothetical protein